MAIVLTGSQKVAGEIQAAMPGALSASVLGDFSAAAVPEGTEALVYTVGADLAALPDYSTLRGEFEALKARKVTIVLAFAAFPQKEEMWLMYWAMVMPFVDLVTMPFADAFKMFEADAFAAKGGAADAEYCATVSLSLINLGCAAVLFTLGADGAYLRTSSVHPRLASMGALAATSDEGWWAREVYRPGAASPVAAAAGMLAGLAAKATPQALLAGLKLGAGVPAAAFAAFKAEDGVAVGPFNKVEA